MLELPTHVPIDGYMTPQDINANYIADLYGETYLADDNAALRKRLVLRALFPGFAVVAIASVAATGVSAVAEESVVSEVSGVLSSEFFPMSYRITAEGERKV